MFRLTATTLRATTIAIPILLATAIAIPSLLATSLPASAQQINVGIGFDNFHNELAPYGTWSNHARWGEVWHPRADRDFRPYYNGHWEDTREYGWLWVSDDRWGDLPYHYGRWVSDPREGWLWVPGYVWAPSWVVWREGGGNIGWFPMPPGDDYYGDGRLSRQFCQPVRLSRLVRTELRQRAVLVALDLCRPGSFPRPEFPQLRRAATRLRKLLLANDEYDQLRHHQQLRRQPQRRQSPPRAGDRSADGAGVGA